MAKIFNNETLGKLVRATWIAWATNQQDIAQHPHWLTEWNRLDERDKHVDRQIGEAIADHVLAEVVRRLAGNMIDPANFTEDDDIDTAEFQNATIRSVAHALGVLDELDRLWNMDAKG